MTLTWPFLASSKLKLVASDVLFIRQSFSLQCMADGIVKDHRHQANWPAVKKILPSWFDQKKEFFRYREAQFKTFCPPVKRQTLIKLLGCFIMTNVYFIQVHYWQWTRWWSQWSKTLSVSSFNSFLPGNFHSGDRFFFLSSLNFSKLNILAPRIKFL